MAKIEAKAEMKKTNESLSNGAKREKHLYNVLSVLLLFAGAYLFFDFAYNVANMIGAAVSGTPEQSLIQLKRVLPQILATVLLVIQGTALVYAYKARDKKERATHIKRSGVLSVLFGIAMLVYVINGVSTGLYEGYIEGYPYLLFPLDFALGGVAAILFGLAQTGEGFKEKTEPSKLPCIKNEKCIFTAILDAIFYPIIYATALYSAAALCYAVFIMDFSHGYIFYNVMLLASFALPLAMFIYYRFFFFNLTEKYRIKAQLAASICFLATSTVIMGLYLLSVELQNEAPAQNAFGLLPIEFTASFNAFPIIYGLANILAPLSALIKALAKKK